MYEAYLRKGSSLRKLININLQDTDSIAQERLCRRLGLPFSYIESRGGAFRMSQALLSFFLRKPWLGYRIFPALNEYWECKYYTGVLESEAEKVRTSKNDTLVNTILNCARQDLIREPLQSWPELIGLISQKLIHLRYHEDIAKWEAENRSNFR